MITIIQIALILSDDHTLLKRKGREKYCNQVK